MTGHMPESSASKTVSPSVYLHCIGVPSRRNTRTLSLPLPSDYHRICPLNPFHWSRPCCRLLRQWLPLLPHQWSWQVLSLILFSSSCLLFPQPLFFSSTLSPVSVEGRCPPIPLLNGGRRVFRLHQLPPNSPIYPSLELLYQRSSLVTTSPCCPLKFLDKLLHCLPSLF